MMTEKEKEELRKLGYSNEEILEIERIKLMEKRKQATP